MLFTHRMPELWNSADFITNFFPDHEYSVKYPAVYETFIHLIVVAVVEFAVE